MSYFKNSLFRSGIKALVRHGHNLFKKSFWTNPKSLLEMRSRLRRSRLTPSRKRKGYYSTNTSSKRRKGYSGRKKVRVARKFSSKTSSSVSVGHGLKRAQNHQDLAVKRNLIGAKKFLKATKSAPVLISQDKENGIARSGAGRCGYLGFSFAVSENAVWNMMQAVKFMSAAPNVNGGPTGYVPLQSVNTVNEDMVGATGVGTGPTYYFRQMFGGNFRFNATMDIEWVNASASLCYVDIYVYKTKVKEGVAQTQLLTDIAAASVNVLAPNDDLDGQLGITGYKNWPEDYLAVGADPMRCPWFKSVWSRKKLQSLVLRPGQNIKHHIDCGTQVLNLNSLAHQGFTATGKIFSTCGGLIMAHFRGSVGMYTGGNSQNGQGTACSVLPCEIGAVVSQKNYYKCVKPVSGSKLLFSNQTENDDYSIAANQQFINDETDGPQIQNNV